MALRKLPYIPLYVQDYLTDEKLNQCSASSQGIYIKIMCTLHKSEPYGTILLKQKDKQNSSTTLNFACKFAKLLPFTVKELEEALNELIEEEVLSIDGDSLFQKRMVRDCELSEKRALAGSMGGKSTFKGKDLLKQKAKQKRSKGASKSASKSEANSEDEYEYEYEDESINNIIKEVVEYLNLKLGSKYKPSAEANKKHIRARLNEKYSLEDFKIVIDKKIDEWKGTQWEKFLRPETLFSPKFEGYLNQGENKKEDDNPYGIEF